MIRTTLNSIRAAKTNGTLKSGISCSVNTIMTDTATIQNYRVKTSIPGWVLSGWRASCRMYRRTLTRTCSCRSSTKRKKSAVNVTEKTQNWMSRSKSSPTTSVRLLLPSETERCLRTKDAVMSYADCSVVLSVMQKCSESNVRSCTNSLIQSAASWSIFIRKFRKKQISSNVSSKTRKSDSTRHCMTVLPS